LDYEIYSVSGVTKIRFKTYKYGYTDCSASDVALGFVVHKDTACHDCNLFAVLSGATPMTDCSVPQDLLLRIYNGTPFETGDPYRLYVNCDDIANYSGFTYGTTGNCDEFVLYQVDPNVSWEMLIGDAANCQTKLRFLGMETDCTVHPTPTPTRTLTPTKTASPTPAVTSSSTPTLTPTTTVTNTPSKSVTQTRTPNATPTNTPTNSVSPTVTPTNTPSPTASLTPTNTLTPTKTPSHTPTQTVTSSHTPTNSVTPTNTMTASVTPVVSSTPSVTPTKSITPTRTVTGSNTPTPSISISASPGASATPTPSVTPTKSLTPSITPSAAPEAGQTSQIIVTFDGNPTSAEASFADLKYDKDGVFNLEMDDRQANFLNILAYLNGGVAPIDGQNYGGKTFTDGAGNAVKYRAAVAVNAHSNFNDGELNDPSHLTTANLQSLLSVDFMLENHGYYHNMDGYYTTNGFTQYDNINENTKYIWDLTGFLSRVWITPNNDTGYNPLVEQLGYLASTSQSVTDGYTSFPPNMFTDHIADLSGVTADYSVFLRDFTDQWNDTTTVDDLKSKITTLANTSNATRHRLYRVGTHDVSTDWSAFKSFIDHIGTVGNDKIWVTTLQEMLEYFEMKKHLVMTYNVVGNQMFINLDYSNVPVNNRFRDITIKVTSDVTVNNYIISGSGHDSATSSTTNKLINLFKKQTLAPDPSEATAPTFNSQVPLVLDNFYQDNSETNSPITLIDGDLTEPFLPAWTLIYEPHEVSVDLKDYNAIVRKVRIYDRQGPNNQDTKVILVRKDSGAELEIGTFTGNGWETWVEYTPSDFFIADKLILRGPSDQSYGTELQIIADYLPYTEPTYSRPLKPLKNFLGVNAHWWNFSYNTGDVRLRQEVLDAVLDLGITSIRNYGNAAEYQPLIDQWAFNPVRQGWYEEDAASYFKNHGIIYWSVLQGQFDHVKASWDVADEGNVVYGTVTNYTNYGSWGALNITTTSNVGGGSYSHWIITLEDAPQSGHTLSEYTTRSDSYNTIPTTHPASMGFAVAGNLPYIVGQHVKVSKSQASQLNIYWDDNNQRDQVSTYQELGKAAFVFASRKGTNPNAPSYATWSHADYGQWWIPRNEPLIATNTADLFEGMNEPNAYWAGIDDFLKGQYLAAAWSMMYDGHKGLYPNCGVKNADPNFKMSISGLATTETDLLRGCYEWARRNRGLNPDGTVDLPFDIIQYHNYSYTGGSNQYAGGTNAGLPPEASNMMSAITDMLHYSNKYAAGKEVWVGEWGIDINPDSPMNAPAYSTYSAEQCRGNWAMRTILEFAAHGLDRSQWFRLFTDANGDNDPTQFASMSLLKEVTTTNIQRRIVGDYWAQLGGEFGDYKFVERINNENPRVLKFSDGTNDMYAIWAVETITPNAGARPTFTENTGTYNLYLNNGTQVSIRQFVDGSSFMSSDFTGVTNGYLSIPYSAKPVIVQVLSYGNTTPTPTPTPSITKTNTPTPTATFTGSTPTPTPTNTPTISITPSVTPSAGATQFAGRQKIDTFAVDGVGGTAPGLTWLPTSYDTDGPSSSYPLIIFLHGMEESQENGDASILNNTGLPMLIANGFDVEAAHPVSGTTFKFIVCSPQHPWFSYGYPELEYILNDIKSKYRVDASRVYVTGLSSGAQGSVSSVTNTESFAEQIAAIVPMSLSGYNTQQEKDNVYLIGGTYHVGTWAIQGTLDGWYVHSQYLVNTINNAFPAPTEPAILTGIPNVGHSSLVWNTAYDPSWKNNANNQVGLSIYEWMLLHKR
jgi:hypothetical protein